ncbi:MAG: aconitate hydratase AcnA, partial [Candidatus Ancillula sp.]|nr:aconitate hydratase AcnA [Candidatus Ancillula sp.]
MKLSELPKTKNVQTLPYCLKVLLENLIRNQDGVDITQEHIDKLSNWQPNSNEQFEIQFTPARVIMQDFTGVPCVVDLATMREAAKDLGIDPEKINPLKQTNLIIDHSVQIDYAGSGDAFEKNLDLDYQRNSERYQFLKWGANSLDNFKVVPPAKGIIHQINLEKIADVVREDSNSGVFFDSCVGTDSHTTMENSLGILGWGVGGIEAEAALLGQPISMLVPEVVGFEITGEPKDFVTTTDIVLTIVEMLRKLGVVGKFVEFYGSGVKNLQLADRATISNMCPEFGATCAIFAIDQQTIDYLRLTGRSEEHLKQIEEYAKIQNCWGDSSTWSEPARYSETLSLNLSTVVSSISGPKRPQDRINLVDMNLEFKNSRDNSKNIEDVHDNDVVIASITSCTNTSNPAVLIGAGLLAKKAVQKGLNSKPWVKTSLAPGSRVVPAYLDKASLTQDLDKLGFQLVGFGCATCIGNSGPLAESVHNQIQEQDLSVAAVLSGNRNFEGRISPDVKLNFLASPPLVIAYAIAGRIDFDFENTPLGQDKNGQDVFLKDIWPSRQEIQAVQNNVLSSELFNQEYQDIFEGDSRWQNLKVETGETYEWDLRSTYVRKAPYFDNMSREISDVKDIKDAYVLAWLGDSVTTDHISPAGSIKEDSPAGKYLQNQGVSVRDFNSYGSRRGNHEVMVRGTFAN